MFSPTVKEVWEAWEVCYVEKVQCVKCVKCVQKVGDFRLPILMFSPTVKEVWEAWEVWRFRIRDLGLGIHDTIRKSPIHSLMHSFVRRLGKTRGAIGFVLIFLCFVSLYQDKEMKKKDKRKRKRLGIWMFDVWRLGRL